MAYSTGSAADYTAVRTAIINACVADGWTWDSVNEYLSKGTIFTRVYLTSNVNGAFLAIQGARGVDDTLSTTVGMGNFNSVPTLAFPVTYHVFTFPNEIYCVVGSGDEYRWLSFGQSQQPGLTGSGNFVSASSRVSPGQVQMATYNRSSSMTNLVAPGLFWAQKASSEAQTYQVDNDLDPLTTGAPWGLYYTGNTAGSYYDEYWTIGTDFCVGLLDSQPNNYNMETVLIPIRGYKSRPDYKTSQVIELENARHIRNDHYQNEEIITLGTDKWMTFPYYKKDPTNRDATSNDSSGTYGMAIRYEGP